MSVRFKVPVSGEAESRSGGSLKTAVTYLVFALALLTPVCVLGWCFLSVEVQLRREDGACLRGRSKVAAMLRLAQAELMIGQFKPEPIAARGRFQNSR